MNNNNNGRVNIKSPNTSALFQMYDKMPANQCVTFRNATEGLWEDSVLSNAYFSQENIKIIQNGIRAGVYKRSNGQYVVAEGDCDVIKIVMRSVFLQYSANKQTNIREQIEELNKIVLDYFIPQVYSEAKGYMNYVNDASTLVVPISHPIQTSANDKQLELKKWF
jgi:hypothetical protein